MLKQIQIKNYALIDQLDVSFKEGYNVITGETGAGKSILLGALGFALGNRADTGVLYEKEKKCVVEALFELKDNSLKGLFEENELDFERECTFRRELNPQKKSRAFINDTPVSLQTMKDIGDHLVDIHSQHDSLLLTDSGFQLRLLDEIAQDEACLADYQRLYETFIGLNKKLTELKETSSKNLSEYDYLKFQLDELAKAQLKEEEYAEIEKTLRIMENSEEVKNLLVEANMLMDDSDHAILEQINALEATLQKMNRFMPEKESMVKRVEELKVELRDIAYELHHWESETQFDETQLESLQERYDLLNRLMLKHRINDFGSLITLRDNLQDRIAAFENLDEDIVLTEKQLKDVENQLSQQAKLLHDRRCEAAETFSKTVTDSVRQLAMPFARFQATVDATNEYTHSGYDHIRFLFSANKGIAATDLGRVASGGELSRLMLSIKSVLAQFNYIPTLVFDEIDTGVSGEVAAKIGDIMQQLGKTSQLIAITHLPQVASKAQHHYFIYKDEEGSHTRSHIKALEPKERVAEIAKLLSNDTITPEALKAAEVLLAPAII